MRRPFAAIACCLAGIAIEANADDRRAHVNYMLHCQGCHLPDGEGIEGRVPPLKDFVGLFPNSDDGRAYLINVSGVAMSALDDEKLSELINWVLRTFSKEELPVPFRPYTASEVAGLRKQPEIDPQTRRARILENLRETNPELPIPGSREKEGGIDATDARHPGAEPGVTT